ncbi:Leucine-rich repeat-containing protein 3 [Galemys pyrenaicus]|uniref:Leucine-rich repeat-containing protein 3 n=1 Tax=Galemys pyrenaicus TaxID=202257 RepID=A0A8J5ZGK1_GALPY|nr:Leucine-rich repeat-containing protein 3 [Galemys pyrenaicus]
MLMAPDRFFQNKRISSPLASKEFVSVPVAPPADRALGKGQRTPEHSGVPHPGAGRMGPKGPTGGPCLLLLVCLRLGTCCPQSCQCPDSSGAVAVDCSSRGLQEIPKDIPADAVSLRLDANNIARVPNGAFQHLSQLRELDLSQNAIETLGPAAFAGLAGGLRLLDLSHNRIRRIPKDALGKLSAKIRLSHNPLHCECALQEALWELKLDPDSVDEMACHTAVREEYVGQPLIQALDAGVSFCSVHHRTTDVAMLVTMFGWFAMVITYVVCYVRQNQEDARKHLEYLKSLPSAPDQGPSALRPRPPAPLPARPARWPLQPAPSGRR